MEARIESLLKKINYKEEYFSYFDNASIEKIVVHEEENAYFLCDAIRIMAIEKELKKYEKTLDK